MSIRDDGDGYHAVECDLCGDEIASEASFDEAVSAAKRQHAVRRGDGGAWEHICRPCQRAERVAAARRKFT